MTEWKQVHGSQINKPQEFDTSSSQVYVYQRKNIQRISKQDPMSDTTYELWQYDERKMTREEYAILIADIQQQQINQYRADLEYVATMYDIDLGGDS